MIKAFFVDFYGTIVHEDGKIVGEISNMICESGKAESIHEVGNFW